MVTMGAKIYRACAYLRLSREDDETRGGRDESNSIRSQRLMVQNFIKTMDDIELVMEVCDDGYTGTDYERPAFKQMIEAIEEGRVDCVIVKDLSRLGRESIGAGEFIQNYFPKKQVRFIAINDHYDSLTADSNERYMVVPVKNFVNESYCRDISLKSRSNQKAKRMNGEFIGAFCCYGYCKDSVDKNRIVPDPEAAEVVRDIFAWKLAGVSANAIAVRLNDRGTLSPAEYKKKKGMKYKTCFKRNPEAKWTAKAVLRILTNEVYTGVLEQGKREKVSFKVKKTIKKPKEEWIRVENSHEPIIGKDDFMAVQELIKRDTRAKEKRSEPKMYAGLLFCGDCGCGMVSRTVPYKDKRTEYYICSTYNRGNGCSRHSIRVEELDAIVLGEIRKFIRMLLDVEKILDRVDRKKLNFEEALLRDKEIQALKEKEQELSAMKSSLYTDLKEKLISEEQFKSYREIYSNQLEQIQQAVRVQEEMIRRIFEQGAVAGAWIEEFRDRLNVEKLDRMLLVSLVDKILVYDDKRVEIVFRYSREMEKAAGTIAACMEAAGNPTDCDILGEVS
jgi:DNA invertase Pin-like site-specific DNA recombinase